MRSDNPITVERYRKINEVAARRQSGLVVVLEDLHDPVNAHKIFRICDGFGVQTIYFIFERERIFNPAKAEKAASASGVKWIDYSIFYSTKECLKQLKQDGYTAVGTVLDERADDLYQTTLSNERIALVMGNEARGLSDTAINLLDRKLYLPMLGMVQSQNVAISTALFLYEITRQRYQNMGRYQLSAKEQQELVNNFTER